MDTALFLQTISAMCSSLSAAITIFTYLVEKRLPDRAQGMYQVRTRGVDTQQLTQVSRFGDEKRNRAELILSYLTMGMALCQVLLFFGYC